MTNNLSDKIGFRVYGDFSDVFVQTQAKHLNKLSSYVTFKVYLLNGGSYIQKVLIVTYCLLLPKAEKNIFCASSESVGFATVSY